MLVSWKLVFRILTVMLFVCYFPDVPDSTIKEKIEHIGNKLPFEKKLNIVAGNGYLGKKKKEYSASKIAITNAMGTSDIQDWDMDSIMKKDIRVSDSITAILKKWNSAYCVICTEYRGGGV